MALGRNPVALDLTHIPGRSSLQHQGQRLRLSDLRLQTGDDPQKVAAVRVVKGQAVEIAGMPTGADLQGHRVPAHVSLLRQLYPQASFIPTPFEGSFLPVVYDFRVGAIAGTTSSLQNSLKIANAGWISALAMGQFSTTTGVYTKNRSRYDLYRNSNYHIYGEDVASTSTVKGMSDMVCGNIIDRFHTFLAPWRISAGQTLGLDIRNEGTTSVYHDMAVVALQEFPENIPLPDGEYELYIGGLRFATTDYTGVFAGPKSFPFTIGDGAWVVAFLAHAEAGSAAITHTALQMKVGLSTGPGSVQIIGGNDTFATDQLLFGANGQRPFVLPTPIAIAENGQFTVELNAAISNTAINYETYVLYLARKQPGG